MKLFKSGKIIKIEGKGFDDLTLDEIALMIEADSSISPEGNEYFASCALDEFLHFSNLNRKDLKKIQERILNNIYKGVDGESAIAVNTDFLKQYAIELRKGDFN